MRLKKSDITYVLSITGVDLFFDEYVFDDNMQYVLLYFDRRLVSVLTDDNVEKLRNLINSANF